MSVTLNVDFERSECYVCGVPMFTPENLRRKFADTGEVFYCVNGHKLSIKDTVQHQLERERLKVRELEAQRNLAEANLDRARKENQRIRRRVEAGVCLHCNRTFSNLAAHMKTQHGPKKKK